MAPSLNNYFIGLLNESLNAFPKPSFDFPKYNVVKTDNGYRAEFALAGYGKGDLEVSFANGVLTIRGEPPVAEKQNSYIFKGIAARPFKVQLAIPYTAKIDAVKFDNGILSMEIGDDVSLKTNNILPIK